MAPGGFGISALGSCRGGAGGTRPPRRSSHRPARCWRSCARRGCWPPAAGRTTDCRACGRRAVRFVLGQRPGDQAAGVLDLPVGEQVRPGLPDRGDAEPFLVGLRQREQDLVHAGQVRGPAVSQRQHHPGQQGAGGQLAVPHAVGQQRLDGRRGAGGVDDRFDGSKPGAAAHRAYRVLPPSTATALASPPGSRPAVMSPSRWQQLIPAACRNAGRPRSRATSASHVARSRLVSGCRQPGPAGQRPGQRVADVMTACVRAAGEQAVAGERCRL